MLTVKQEKYVQELLKGKSQREAYRIAYPTSKKWKDSSVDVTASKLFNTPKVLLRYERLKGEREQEHKAKALWDREQATKGLMWIVAESQKDIKNNGLRHANSTAFINGVKELNELEGIGEEREVKIDKTKAEIERIKSETNSVENTENKLKDYFEALEGVLDGTK